MSIVIIRQDNKIEAWKTALEESAKDIQFFSFLEPHPKEDIKVAFVWKHPVGILKDYPNLKYIASFGAGVDFLLDDDTISTDLPITRVVDPILASDMSEFVLASILEYLKNLTHYKKDQLETVWKPQTYRRITDVKVGIMGMGALGSDLAKTLTNVGFEVVGFANSSKKESSIKVYCGHKERNSFLRESNILVCLLPLTPQTEGILNSDLFSQLPKGAYIINVARGGHLNDQDLLDSIDRGQLSGASLDVFHEEPLRENHPFWTHEKINITPHIASVSDITSVIPQLLENYDRFKRDLPLNNLVLRQKGY